MTPLMGTMLENMGEKQSGFHIDVGILDNDACALEMISLLLRQRDAAIRIGWSDTNAQYTLERMVFGPLSDAVTVKVIVLDLALNGISGIDVCRQIRLRDSRVGILGVSSYALDQYRQRLALAGAQGLFSKQEILFAGFRKCGTYRGIWEKCGCRPWFFFPLKKRMRAFMLFRK